MTACPINGSTCDCIVPCRPKCERCGEPLGRNGKCPALCEPLPVPPPRYTGPLVVGRTHLGRMARPVGDDR